MKQLILDSNNTILYVGDTYSTAVDDVDSARTVHIVDGQRFDQNFGHTTASELPANFAIGIYKFIDGQFVENTDRTTEIEQQGYDQAVYDIYVGGNE